MPPPPPAPPCGSGGSAGAPDGPLGDGSGWTGGAGDAPTLFADAPTVQLPNATSATAVTTKVTNLAFTPAKRSLPTATPFQTTLPVVADTIEACFSLASLQ